jgi:hypothetical protein
MLNSVAPAIEWISARIESEVRKSASYSLWSALYYHHQSTPSLKLPAPPMGAAPRLVYVAGTLKGFKNHLFSKIEQTDKIVFLVYDEEYLKDEHDYRVLASSEPVLRYMTICYIPVQLISNYQEDVHRITVFTEGKPEIWMRTLLAMRKVCGLVGWDKPVNENWQVNWLTSYESFSYSLLLEDQQRHSAETRLPLLGDKQMIPIGLKLGLQRALKETNNRKRTELWLQTLDVAAAQLLDEYWIIHQPQIEHYLPQLIDKVIQYLEVVQSLPAGPENVNKAAVLMEQWWTMEEILYAR